MLAHTLGNPFRADILEKFADDNDIYLIEDSCDAVGATIDERPVGSFGDLSTTSFYPAHHITMGEGGCVLTRSTMLKKIIESFRDWGRDCWCPPGRDNTCGKRFEWDFDDLPSGYDHKYVYSHIGYNLKLTDMQAAVGVAQLDKLDEFISARRRNWQYLRDGLRQFEPFLILPKETPGTKASWFGFPITVREDSKVRRRDLVKHLEENRIATRLLFGGNIVRQPAYRDIRFEQSGDLVNSDRVAVGTFWIGVYPGLTTTHLDYVIDTFTRFPWTDG
jgi:CDP-6-deoxy-D-xylo-4-hexulose-3-dehydrase